jgi:hypothetical protein
MKKIHVSEVRGFRCKDKTIQIFDDKKKPFYLRLNPNAETCYFNLPIGTYFTKNNIKNNSVVAYDIPNLPKPEKLFPIPKKFFIVVTKNPNKCTVYMRSGKIDFDRDFLKSLNKPTITFIFLHEFAHYLYSDYGNDSEKKCDTYATIKMLEKGYNPNQILKASLNSLTNSQNSKERKVNTFNHAKNA